MGIKGIWGEVGKGHRTALAKLAVQKLEETGRPLRIAVDAPIWLYQIKNGKGGASPALRTLFYRLVNLLRFSIRLLFVFDGSAKPPFKRDAPTLAGGSFDIAQARELLKLLAFPCLTAPGEAEAECALLQSKGVVDAVWSEDGDTLAFGCTLLMRNWGSQNSRGAKLRTHIDIYDSEIMNSDEYGLDRDGIILVALLSGGDYIPAGVRKCGIKVACQAARAGFGRELLTISLDNATDIHEWRERLRHELRTNESGFFKTRHSALEIPDSFPDLKVLNYYAKPEVSSLRRVSEIENQIIWNGEIDISGLRVFVGEKFEWNHYQGTKKFIRRLAPSLVSYDLWSRAIVQLEPKKSCSRAVADVALTISGRREHSATDSVPELRISFIPAHIVGLNLANETADASDNELSDSESEGEDALITDVDGFSASSDRTRKKAPSTYDPLASEKIWVLEAYVKLGEPARVREWEARGNGAPKLPVQRIQGRRALPKSGMKAGALERYVRISKPRNCESYSTENFCSAPKDSNSRGLPAVTSPKPRRFFQSQVAGLQCKTPTKPPWGGSSNFRLPPNDGGHLRAISAEGRGQNFSLGWSVKQPVVIDDLVSTHEDECIFSELSQSQKPGNVMGSSSGQVFPVSSFPKHTSMALTRSLGQRGEKTLPSNQATRRVVIRESLEGAWRMLNESEDGVPMANRRFSGIEVLNLTGNF